MNGTGDDNLVPGLAQEPQASLQRQNERLQLLLNLTSRITSNLDLREVLRAARVTGTFLVPLRLPPRRMVCRGGSCKSWSGATCVSRIQRRRSTQAI